jgi:hypothetical protein
MVQVLDYGSVPARKIDDAPQKGRNKLHLLITAVVATCAIAVCVAVVNYQVQKESGFLSFSADFKVYLIG